MVEPKKMQTKPEGTHVEISDFKLDFSGVVGGGITRIMRDGPTAMTNLERAFDEVVDGLAFEERKAQRQSVLEMLTNARGAIESLYVRAQQKF